MNYLLYVILGVLPSATWLLFYLRKDSHPEPKKTILLVFLGGALMGPIALLVQFLAMMLLSPSSQWPALFAAISQNQYLFLFNVVLFAPFSEELLKYLVVKWQVLQNPDFDEPLDAMIYLVVSALGFAAAENLLNIFLLPNLTPQLAASQAFVRFLSATFLHALSSGILGYFIAYALFNLKKRMAIFLTGFLSATFLHGLYNYLAWLYDSNKFFAIILALLLILMGGIINWQFRHLKKQLSICKIR